jgi:hypothetical protein
LIHTEKITMLSCERINALLHRFGWLFALPMLIAGSGCVERRMVILSAPYGSPSNGPDLGAIVYDEKNQPIGAAPVDKPFTYYGKYRFRLAKDGYETLVVDQRVRSPWYELPGLDFFAENVIPWTIRDVRYFRYELKPAEIRTPEQMLQSGQLLRDYGKTIGAPLPDLNPPVGAPPTVLQPPIGDDKVTR